ncbi:uncharacterized protein LOC108626405 isoform X2 [Ceratina calcarata]|uniref:Uncharacterized protein LOC108626405 isoform X2 n=1 Tax=Ceratina calcarata TaxID=156304 RepID=A0AAJ7S480_9HYME|nr:uncharacterized protein LOC108626405 isoform X2 [Ceratina calcarata]
MCKSISLLQDQTSVNEYLEYIRTWMKDTTSLVATSIKSGRVIGVAVARINSDPEKTDSYDRAQITEGAILRKILQLLDRLMVQTKAHERFQCTEYFCVYILCVHPSYQEKGVEIALLDACLQVSNYLRRYGTVRGSSTTGSFSMILAGETTPPRLWVNSYRKRKTRKMLKYHLPIPQLKLLSRTKYKCFNNKMY